MTDRYRVFPCAVAVDRAWRFSLESPFGSRRAFDGRRLRVSVTSVHDYRHRASVPLEPGPAGEPTFTFTPEVAGEYLVGVHDGDGAWPDRPLEQTSFYAEAADVVATVPWKGDLHMHTVRSDGQEEPEALLSRMRGLGLDFVAITDHRVYGAGSSAKGAQGDGYLPDGSRIDLLVLPGEEINYCQGLGHVISLNARRGVSQTLRVNAGDRGYLESFVNMDALTDPVFADVEADLARTVLPTGVDRRLYGFLYALVKAIRGAGGVAVIAHPFWSSHGAMDLVRSTWDHVVRTQLYDAIEVFGGMSPEENLLSYAHYASKLSIAEAPIVGCSDSHGGGDEDWAGRSFTLAFTRRLSTEGLVRAIASRRTTACLRVNPTDHLVAGDFRFVEYSHFLLRTFFPHHDFRCRLLGDLYRACLREETTGAESHTAGVREALARDYRRYFPVAFEDR